MFRLSALFLLLFLPIAGVAAATQTPPLKIAILDFGNSSPAQVSSAAFVNNLKIDWLNILDRDESRAASRGAGYSGSLNLTKQEARNLGSALGCDYYFLGDAQTLRRSPSSGQTYFESYASIFLVSARTGKLIVWERPTFKSEVSAEAEKLLVAELSSKELRTRFHAALQSAQREEAKQLEISNESVNPVIEEAPDESQAEASGIQLPRAFRRLRPAYPETAAHAEAEATVDVLADIDINGEITHMEIARWAGFGLDESSMQTVSQLHFFPAMRNRIPIPLRVLLRYNFRKPPKQ